MQFLIWSLITKVNYLFKQENKRGAMFQEDYMLFLSLIIALTPAALGVGIIYISKLFKKELSEFIYLKVILTSILIEILLFVFLVNR